MMKLFKSQKKSIGPSLKKKFKKKIRHLKLKREKNSMI